MSDWRLLLSPAPVQHSPQSPDRRVRGRQKSNVKNARPRPSLQTWLLVTRYRYPSNALQLSCSRLDAGQAGIVHRPTHKSGLRPCLHGRRGRLGPRNSAWLVLGGLLRSPAPVQHSPQSPDRRVRGRQKSNVKNARPRPSLPTWLLVTRYRYPSNALQLSCSRLDA